jgi:hypothetical protein
MDAAMLVPAASDVSPADVDVRLHFQTCALRLHVMLQQLAAASSVSGDRSGGGGGGASIAMPSSLLSPPCRMDSSEPVAAQPSVLPPPASTAATLSEMANALYSAGGASRDRVHHRHHAHSHAPSHSHSHSQSHSQVHGRGHRQDHEADDSDFEELSGGSGSDGDVDGPQRAPVAASQAKQAVELGAGDAHRFAGRSRAIEAAASVVEVQWCPPCALSPPSVRPAVRP